MNQSTNPAHDCTNHVPTGQAYSVSLKLSVRVLQHSWPQVYKTVGLRNRTSEPEFYGTKTTCDEIEIQHYILLITMFIYMLKLR